MKDGGESSAEGGAGRRANLTPPVSIFDFEGKTGVCFGEGLVGSLDANVFLINIIHVYENLKRTCIFFCFWSFHFCFHVEKSEYLKIAACQ